jgi:hypothetical protein
MNTDGKLHNRQNANGGDEVKDGGETMDDPRIELMYKQFLAAMKEGRVAFAEEIPDAEPDHPAAPKALVHADGVSMKENAVHVSKKVGQKTIIDTVADFLQRFVFL